MQVLKIVLKVLLVVPTCQPIHSSCSILLEFRECFFEVINTDVMEEGAVRNAVGIRYGVFPGNT